MFILLSKLIPPFLYPLGLGCILILVALFLQKRAGWQKASLILALVLLWGGSTNWASLLLARPLEWRYLPPQELTDPQVVPLAEVIVLLGGGTDTAFYPRPNPELNGAGDRVLYAAYLYQQGKAPKILVSGGGIDWMQPKISSAQDMAELLQLMGVPQEAIWLEPTSRNTYENAVNSRQILAEKGIQRIILVTSASHMPRSVGLFEKQGFEVIPAPTDFQTTQETWERLWQPNLLTQIVNFLPNADNLSSAAKLLKEYLGLLVYRLRGWL